MKLPKPNQFGSYILSDGSIIHESKKIVEGKKENQVVSNHCYFMLVCVGYSENAMDRPILELIFHKNAIQYVNTPQEALSQIVNYKNYHHIGQHSKEE